jgi:tRNA (guanine26-N2/guanine27-N2)-dimethyltransferase
VVFSHSTDHYIRLYAEISYGAKKADESVKSLGYVLHCFSCLHRETATAPFSKNLEKCPECGARMDYAGPLCLGRILDKQFCESMAKENMHRAFRNTARITKLLALTIDEAEAPLTYCVIDKVSNKLGLPVPSVAAMLKILHDNGFQAVQTHFSSRGLRTNAPALIMQNLVKKAISAR